MAKKRPNRDPDKRPEKKRRKTDEAESDDDPLGKLVKEYGVNLAESLVGGGVIGLVGGGLMAYGLSRDPYSLGWTLAGGVVVLAAVVMLGLSLLNVGRKLELRKRGIRWTEFGMVTEFAWDDISDVEIDRRDETYLGVASVQKRSSDAVSSSGPLTKTEWDVTIHAHDGRTIHLRPLFLRTVPDPKKLLSQIRLGAGLR
jgi:hypothetical protein